MSISFAESLRLVQEQYDIATRKSTTLKSNGGLSVYAADSATDEEWAPIENQGYLFYTEYDDSNLSLVDEDKNVILDSSQVNITQETNSQYIPFQMPRFYDGFDLTKTKMRFYYVNRLGEYGFDYPVDVYYSSDKIKFAWLIDSNVTATDGGVSFEIQAVGRNSKDETYIWKTRTNSQINILKSLAGKKAIVPDETWKDDFIAQTNSAISYCISDINDLDSRVDVLEEDVENIKTTPELSAEEIDILIGL